MQKASISSAVNPSLLSFKPRQVLLATNTNMKHNEKKNNHKDDDKTTVRTLKTEEKTILLKLIAGYLNFNGLSKTLKKFLSEAEIEKDDLGHPSMNLEDIFCKYLETCDLGNTQVIKQKVQDLKKDNNCEREKEVNSVDGVENIGKKKKKKTDKKVLDATGPEKIEKIKEKKKSKKNKESHSQSSEVSTDITKESVDDGHEPEKKVKDKKKKKSKSEFETKKDDDNKTIEEDTNDYEKKASKKRKRLTSEENDWKPIDKEDVDGSKCQKAEAFKEAKGSEEDKKESNKDDSEENEGQNVQDIKIQKSGEKSSSRKTFKRQENGSAEPTTVKAFQRVKVEEVEFTDDRLRDNSYWAKDGAETGYGAKAQEVLGQVRGRDFRHEKTKKKRGSYKGGYIDLQSHSVKFNYSDGE